MDPRYPVPLRFVWTVFPGVNLVAYESFAGVSVFYTVGPEVVPVRVWDPDQLVAMRDVTGLAFTIGQA